MKNVNMNPRLMDILLILQFMIIGVVAIAMSSIEITVMRLTHFILLIWLYMLYLKWRRLKVEISRIMSISKEEMANKEEFGQKIEKPHLQNRREKRIGWISALFMFLISSLSFLLRIPADMLRDVLLSIMLTDMMLIVLYKINWLNGVFNLISIPISKRQGVYADKQIFPKKKVLKAVIVGAFAGIAYASLLFITTELSALQYLLHSMAITILITGTWAVVRTYELIDFNRSTTS